MPICFVCLFVCLFVCILPVIHNYFIDRVALVAAPPPSYTRMYHYFPAHLTHPFCYYPPAPQTARYPGTAFLRFTGDIKQGGDHYIYFLLLFFLGKVKQKILILFFDF